MKLKKIMKILPEWETIIVWGNDDKKCLYHGVVGYLPKKLDKLKMIPGPEGSYFEIRYGCSDVEDHVAVFVEEEEPKTLVINGKEIKVVYPDKVDKFLTLEDKEMDARCRAAVDEAIRKNEFFNNLNKKKNIN